MTFEQLCVITSSLHKEASLKHASVHGESIYCFSCRTVKIGTVSFFSLKCQASWVRCQVKDTSLGKCPGENAIRLTWKSRPRLCSRKRGWPSAAKRFDFFASLTFTRWNLSRRTPATNLSLDDELQEVHNTSVVSKQFVCFAGTLALIWSSRFLKRGLSFLLPSTQNNTVWHLHLLAPHCQGVFGTSPIIALDVRIWDCEKEICAWENSESPHSR